MTVQTYSSTCVKHGETLRYASGGQCIPCHRERAKARHHSGAYLKKYGITREDYERMLADQGGRCLLCHTDKCEDGGKLCVDHDHATGKVRGLLCRACNLMVGNSGDSPERLRLAAAYLERHQ
jgi:hypothetical protein